MLGLTHKNETLPKIKEGGEREGKRQNVLNRLEDKKTNGLTPPTTTHTTYPTPCNFQKPLDSSQNMLN